MSKFLEVFRFEFSYQIRRVWTWLNVIVLMFLSFLMMRDGSFSEALYTEFFINSPFMVAMTTVFGSLLWLLMSAFIAGEAAARDVAFGMHPLVYTTRLSKLDYLGGRFAAALVLNALLLLSVQGTMILAIYLPGVHPDSIGPFRAEAFLAAYFFIAVPNAIAATALQFAIASRSGRPITAYVGSLLLFFIAFFIASLILFRKGAGTLLDPIGVRFIWNELSHLWTTHEKSWRMLRLDGTLLQNRIIWITTGLLFLVLTFLQFKFSHRIPVSFRIRIPVPFKLKSGHPNRVQEKPAFASANKKLIRNTKRSTSRANLFVPQTLAIMAASFKTLVTSKPGLAMLILVPLMAIPVVVDQMVALGLPLEPITLSVIKELTGPLSADLSRWMIVPGFIIYFTGELIWHERDNKLSELTDSMPGSEWAPLLGKVLGLFLMLLVFTAMLIAAGMVGQAIMGYHHFEIGLYLKVMFGLQLPEYLLFVILAFAAHTVVNQKYIGHLVAIVSYAFIAAIATMLGIEHNLLIYGAGPVWAYTEMRGFAQTIGPWLWFKLYWAAWALLLAIATALLWVRGKDSSFATRLRLTRSRFTRVTSLATFISILAITGAGGYIFYNTNILNRYFNSAETKELRAEYERRYGRYENKPGPQLTGVHLQIEIYPERKSVEISGTYKLINTTKNDIDSIHVSTPMNGAVTKAITFNRESSVRVDDRRLHYLIYKLDKPLNPDDTLEIRFEAAIETHGFRNQGIDPSVTGNSAYFTNSNWFPAVGYQRNRGLVNPAERTEYGLEPRPVLSALHEAHNGDLAPLGRGVNFEATIGTSDDQIAVAPGELKRQWNENGRRYFHYVSSAPIGGEWNFFSANYHVHKKEWIKGISGTNPVKQPTPVNVRILHHPEHTSHLNHMIDGIHASLDYYTDQFGPYPYTHLTVVEHPAATGTGMHADAGLIYYGQGYAHWLSPDDNTLDLPYAVIGHEMGHQWTLPYAYTEGLPFLSEGLAWYYGIMMVKATRSAQQTRRLMSFMRQPYPHAPIRRGEPLLRALDPYLAYKRGPLAMYALSEYAGTENVNKALRTLNEKSHAPAARPVTTLDLYRELRAVTPDSLQNMLREFFEVNTLWQFETTEARAVETAANSWEVILDVKAKKIMYDSTGVETEVPIKDEWIPIGVFARHVHGQDELSAPIYLEKHKIRSGSQTIRIVVTNRPVLAGIDPHHVLDWEEKEDDDNIEEVVIQDLQASEAGK